MAQGRRVERVAALIRREMSQLLMNGIRDEKIQQSMITITEVNLSGDLQHCKIFLSVFGEEPHKEDVLLALNKASGFIRGELGRRLQMRRSPDIIFRLDRGLEKATSVLTLLEKLDEERKIKYQPNEKDLLDEI